MLNERIRESESTFLVRSASSRRTKETSRKSRSLHVNPSHRNNFIFTPLDGADVRLGVECDIRACGEGPPPNAIVPQSCVGQRLTKLLVVNWIPWSICMTPTTTPV